MKERTAILLIAILMLNFICSPRIDNNVLLNVSDDTSVSFFVKEYQDKTHMKFPSDFGIAPTEECDEFYIDSIQGTYFSVCYYPESDTILGKSEINDLARQLFNSIHSDPNKAEFSDIECFRKNNVYTVSIKYDENNLSSAAVFKYSQNKLIKFHFHDFKSRSEIDAIIESVRFEY